MARAANVTPIGTPKVRKYPFWVPDDGAPELTDAKGNIVGIGKPKGRVRLLPVDTTHTATVKIRGEGTGRSQYEAKGYIRLEHAPPEAKVMFAQLRQHAIDWSRSQGLPAPDWTVLYAHFAEGVEVPAKAGKGAADAA